MSKLNIQKLHSRSIGYISNEDSFAKIKPMEWSDEIVKGNKKIVMNKLTKDEKNKCVLLEI